MDLAEAVTFSSLNIKESPSNIVNFAAKIDGRHTEFVICYFQNTITYIVTQLGKIGNIYSVEAEQVENGVVDNEPVYNLKPLLGGGSIELEAGIRYLAGKLNHNKPLLFSLTLTDYTVNHLKLVLQAIKEFKN